MKKLALLAWLIAHNFIAEPKVYFIEPKNNDVITERTFKVQFGLEGFGIAPAGYDIPNTGHHHLLIDTFIPEDLTKPIPANKNHIHFGLGQTETTITLEPGEHSLRVVLGNYLHVPHTEPIISEEINILVL